MGMNEAIERFHAQDSAPRNVLFSGSIFVTRTLPFAQLAIMNLNRRWPRKSSPLHMAQQEVRSDSQARNMPRFVWLWRLFHLLPVLAVGCVNLKPVREFAELSTEKATIRSIASELPASPTRRLRIVEDQEARRSLTNAIALGREAQQALLGGHRVVEAYMSALAELASDGIVTKNTSFSGLADAVRATKVFEASEVDAIGKLSSLLARGLTDFYRRSRVREMVMNANEPLQLVLAALMTNVTQRCVRELEIERRSVRAYFDDAIADSTGDSSPGIKLLLRETRDARLDAIDAKIQTAKNYGEVLQTIRKGHSELKAKLHRMGTKEWVQLIKGYSADLRSAHAAIKQLRE